MAMAQASWSILTSGTAWLQLIRLSPDAEWVGSRTLMVLISLSSSFLPGLARGDHMSMAEQ